MRILPDSERETTLHAEMEEVIKRSRLQLLLMWKRVDSRKSPDWDALPTRVDSSLPLEG